MSEQIQYGDKVTFTQKLVRCVRDEYVDTPYSTHRIRKEFKFWREVTANGAGLFLGYRTLQNGYRDYDYDYGYSFKQSETVKVALVSPGPKLNPIYVPLTALSN